MMSTAMIIASDHGDDANAAWDAALALSNEIHVKPHGPRDVGEAPLRVDFEDGSALVFAPGGYDLRPDDGTRSCWCWAGLGHEDDCKERGTCRCHACDEPFDAEDTRADEHGNHYCPSCCPSCHGRQTCEEDHCREEL